MEYHANGGGGVLRHAIGASLSSWFLKAAGLSCSTTTAGSWFHQSLTVLAANELRSPDEDAPKYKPMIRPGSVIRSHLRPIWSGPMATCPVTTLYNKASLRSCQRSLRSRQPRSCSIWVTLDVVLWPPLTNLLMFADNTKISRIVTEVEDGFLLQQDLDCLMESSKYWHIDFNIDKCKIMRIQQCCHDMFKVNGNKLQKVTEEKDLGIVVTNDLKPSVQCSETAAIASKGYAGAWDNR